MDRSEAAPRVPIVKIAPAFAIKTLLHELAWRTAATIGRAGLGVGIPAWSWPVARIQIFLVAIHALARHRDAIGRWRGGIGNAVCARWRHAIGLRPARVLVDVCVTW